MYIVENIDGSSIVETDKLNEAVRETIDFLLNIGISIDTIKTYKNTILLTEEELIEKVNNSSIDSDRKNVALDMILNKQKIFGISHGDLRYTYLKDNLWVRDGLGIKDITDKFFNPMNEDNIIQYLDTTKKVDLSEITRQDIFNAIQKYDELKKLGQLNKRRENKKFTLFVNSDEYPHKYIVSIAYGLKYEEETLNAEYIYATGTQKYSAQWCLKNLGFELFSDDKFKACLKQKYLNENTQNTYYNDLKKVIKILQKIKAYAGKNIIEIFKLVEINSLNFEEYDLAQKSLGYDDKQLFQTFKTKIKEYMSCIYDSDVEKSTKMQEGNSEMKETSIRQPLNQILYGPPGTGKTYQTINKTLEILLEGEQDQEKKIEFEYRDYKLSTTVEKLMNLLKQEISTNDTRKQLKAAFEFYKNEKQIEFVTFHQSYGYEEFVEGIKAIPVGKEGNDSSEMIYDVADGIFKRLCNEAQNKSYEFDAITKVVSTAKVWKISLGGSGKDHQVKKDCFNDELIRIGWESVLNIGDEEYQHLGLKVKNTLENFFEEMEIGDFVISLGNQKEADAIGIIEGEYEKDDYEDYPHKRKVKWLKKNTALNIYELNGHKNLVQQTVYRLHRIKPEALLSLANIGDLEVSEDNSEHNYVLIIDEINRGNISKIFGELITLIEESKRIGASEELRVTLPYSGNTEEPFGVPENVYLIGTMNTADRSIAPIDTALRRRFVFEEKLPKPELLKETNDGINLREILESINIRIEYLYDRDHTIGHTYLLDVNNIDGLKFAFKNRIIPLLAEYFYEDWGNIKLVLGESNAQEGLIKQKDDTSKYLSNMSNRLNNKVLYEINENPTKNDFKRIYGEENKKTEIDNNDQVTSN